MQSVLQRPFNNARHLTATSSVGLRCTRPRTTTTTVNDLRLIRTATLVGLPTFNCLFSVILYWTFYVLILRYGMACIAGLPDRRVL